VNERARNQNTCGVCRDAGPVQAGKRRARTERVQEASGDTGNLRGPGYCDCCGSTHKGYWCYLELDRKRMERMRRESENPRFSRSTKADEVPGPNPVRARELERIENEWKWREFLWWHWYQTHARYPAAEAIRRDFPRGNWPDFFKCSGGCSTVDIDGFGSWGMQVRLWEDRADLDDAARRLPAEVAR